MYTTKQLINLTFVFFFLQFIRIKFLIVFGDCAFEQSYLLLQASCIILETSLLLIHLLLKVLYYQFQFGVLLFEGFSAFHFFS